MEQSNLVKLIKLLKKHHVTHYKDNEVELVFDSPDEAKASRKQVKTTKSRDIDQVVEPPAKSEEPQVTLKDAVSMINNAEDMNEDDWLYYSSGYDPKDDRLEDPAIASKVSAPPPKEESVS